MNFIIIKDGNENLCPVNLDYVALIRKQPMEITIHYALGDVKNQTFTYGSISECSNVYDDLLLKIQG